MGNRTTLTVTTPPSGTQVTTYAYDDADRITTVDGTPYTYDNRGNLTGDGTWTYTYDGAGRLVRTETITTTQVYTYNGDGLLVAQEIDGVETVFAWDQALELPQVLATSDGMKSLYGLDRIGVLQASAWRYPLPDALGSVRQWTDPAGAVLATQSYGPFGEAREPLGIPPWGFTGEWHDPTGMVYLRARWYNPTLGRFAQVDAVTGPLAAPATWQPYAYALNNPLRYSDASGRFPWIIVGVVAAAGLIDYGAQVYRNRQAGLDWGAALTTNINLREVVSVAGAAGLATVAVPELVSMAGLGLSATGHGLYGLSQTLGGSSGAIPQCLAGSSAWASTALWSSGAAVSGAAESAAQAIYGLKTCPSLDPSVGRIRSSTANVTLEDLFENPGLLEGMTPQELEALARSEGWSIDNLARGAHAGQGLVIREVDASGKLTGRMIQWHPGGGHHGPQPYFKISSPRTGTVRIGPQF